VIDIFNNNSGPQGWIIVISFSEELCLAEVAAEAHKLLSFHILSWFVQQRL
jgi:hypothetical protein